MPYEQGQLARLGNNESVSKNHRCFQSTIALRGAEHRKNKCASKKDKHQKGLKQRKTQRQNAERRLEQHAFCFTTHYELHPHDAAQRAKDQGKEAV